MNNSTFTISTVGQFLESWAHSSLAESYDNVGLLVGKANQPVSKILVSLDSTEDVVDEAVRLGCELIISHHPILFKGLNRLNGQNYVARTVEKAIKQNIGLYAIHTNLDNVTLGVNLKMAQKIGLENVEILRPAKSKLLQLSFFVPSESKEKVLKAIHLAGAGNIGNYSDCSFSTNVEGRFLPNEQANPAIGNQGKLERVNEIKIDVVLPKHLKNNVLKALFNSHPYEEVAYFITQLENEWREIGSGMIGSFSKPKPWEEFCSALKAQFGLRMLKHTEVSKPEIQKVALCGGSGFFLLGDAITSQADVYITSDIKYHEFFDAEGLVTLIDIGHFESEQFTSELIVEKLSSKFPNIAVLLSKVRTNPVFYA